MDHEANIAGAKEVDREPDAKPVLKSDSKKKSKQSANKKEKQKSDKKRKKKKSPVSESETSDSDMSSSESSEEDCRRRRKHVKHRKRRVASSESESESDAPKKRSAKHAVLTSDSESDTKSRKKRHVSASESETEDKSRKKRRAKQESETEKVEESGDVLGQIMQRLELLELTKDGKSPSKKSKKSKKSKSSTYKRVDQLWDNNTHNFKLRETADKDDTEFAEYAFNVRRRFDFKGQYLFTVVDIKSSLLKKALSEVVKDTTSICLDAEEPTIDPHLLFLYVEQIREYYKKTLKSQIKKERKKKLIKQLQTQRALCKLLVEYIDEDYAEIKKTLYPLLEAGNITFDLAWALFKPGEMVVTSTYGQWSEPRCFKVEYAHKQSTLSRGEYYALEGKYLECSGTSFGFGDFELDIEAFKGARKISSLAAYPLKYHRDQAAVRKQILERGQKFIDHKGMNYRLHKGLAFMKKKKQVLKINVNGRVMVDPATFRRINANYPVSSLRPKDSEDLFSEDSDCTTSDSEQEEAAENLEERLEADEPKVKYEYVQDKAGDYVKVAVEVDEDGNRLAPQKVEELEVKQTFTEEELLLTSSVVLGFAFSEKLWLEFTLSGISDIQYNESAFESLVLPPQQKSIIKALVESHKFNAAKTIDDVVQGKGRSLVTVLHGPPGTGKTLTAESIAELLKCPLYMVSAGELGTEPARLESSLNQILDIAHCWGAIVLLDEADVFLEAREANDVHRNALVSVFLRTLEYLSTILFLTTNRVSTFDDAFTSRIHLALKYGDLTSKAKNHVWRLFFDMCRKQDGCPVADLTDHDFDMLSRHQLNGRQIKNIVKTAQALALSSKQTLGLEHVKTVMDVAESFAKELKGGSGYLEAMRSYT